MHSGVGALLERLQSDGPVRFGADALTDPRLLRATRLTAPDPRLRELAGGPSGARLITNRRLVVIAAG